MSTAEKETRLETSRWSYVAVGFLINICLGAVYAFSVFRPPLQKLWGITATQAGLPFMIFLGTFALGMALAGPLVEKWGPRKTSLLGGALVGAGWILSGFSPNIWILTLLYGVVGGSGVGVMYGCPIAVSGKWFPDKKGLAVGLTVMGFGLSALILAPIADSLIGSMGVVRTFTVLGGVFLVLLLVLALPLRFPPQGWAPKGCEPAGRGAAAGKGKPPVCVFGDLDRGQMVKRGTFYALWGCYTIGCLAGLMSIGIAKPFGLEVAGVSGSLATLAVSIFAIPNALGRPLFGWLTDRLTPRYAAALSFGLILLAAALVYFFGDGSTLLFFVAFVLLYLNLGGWLAIAPTATATFFGTKHYARNYGIVFTAYGVGAILGSILSGMIRDATGSYLSVFLPVMGLAVVGLVVALVGLNPVAAAPSPEQPGPAARK
ncbi:MAG: OFA family MFS transporter [Candidatus Bipolaricaulota bacterium]|nr:OFA family MFS transporter [Candidatus Bipolaricaulota bacterium]